MEWVQIGKDGEFSYEELWDIQVIMLNRHWKSLAIKSLLGVDEIQGEKQVGRGKGKSSEEFKHLMVELRKKNEQGDIKQIARKVGEDQKCVLQWKPRDASISKKEWLAVQNAAMGQVRCVLKTDTCDDVDALVSLEGVVLWRGTVDLNIPLQVQGAKGPYH